MTHCISLRYLFHMQKRAFSPNETVYIVENATRVREASVLRSSGGFCLLRLSGGGGTRFRESRFFRAYGEAENHVRSLREANSPANTDPNRNTGDIGWLG